MIKHLLLFLCFFVCLSANAQFDLQSINHLLEKVKPETHPKNVEFREVEIRVDSIHGFDYVNEGWEETPQVRLFYQYDSDGLVTVEDGYLNDGTGNYYHAQESIFTNNDGLLDTLIINSYDTSTDMWTQFALIDNTYDDDDILVLQDLELDIGIGFLVYVRQFFYYDMESVLDSLVQEVSLDGFNYEYNATITYEYDEEGNQTFATTAQATQTGDIAPAARDSFVYNQYNYLIESHNFAYEDSLWIPAEKTVFDIDDFGFPVEDVTSIWEPAVEGFLKDEKLVYFFEYTTSVNETELLDCMLVNPTQGEVQLQCPTLAEYQNITLEIFDLQGRKVISENLLGQSQINLPTSLYGGTYILLVRSKDNILVSEKLVIQK